MCWLLFPKQLFRLKSCLFELVIPLPPPRTFRLIVERDELGKIVSSVLGPDELGVNGVKIMLYEKHNYL